MSFHDDICFRTYPAATFEELMMGVLEKVGKDAFRKFTNYVKMFHGGLDETTRTNIPFNFCHPESTCRILVTTGKSN